MIRKTLWSLFAFFAFWAGGLAWYGNQMITLEKQAEPARADAIVVLTGGKGRLEYGLQLLAAHKGRLMFVSGVHGKIGILDLLRAMPKDIQASISVLDLASITLGRQAENTIGNAEETVRWINSNKITSIILVTANYHMPRSLSEFKEIMPEVAIIPAPVVYPYDYHLLLSEYHKYLASKFRHWLVSVTPE